MKQSALTSAALRAAERFGVEHVRAVTARFGVDRIRKVPVRDRAKAVRMLETGVTS